jgi:hypothetical protein
MDEAVITSGLFAVHIAGGIKGLEFRGDMNILVGMIEGGNGGDSRTALAESLPGALGIIADGRDQTDTGHYHALGHLLSLLFQ